MNEPLVSICIPTYNRADKLARAVASIQAGTYQHFEIVISDNGSTDQTPEVCKNLASADSRVSFYRHAVNLGPIHNFNFAKSLATGKYFVWHGDDDFVDPEYVRCCVSRLEHDEDLVLVSGTSAYKLNDDKFRYGNVIQLSSDFPTNRIFSYIWKVLDNSIFCGVYRSKPLEDLSMRNTLASDWSWLTSVIYRGKAEVLPHIHTYRDHGDTTSSSLRRICRVLGLPARQAVFSWFYIARNIARDTVIAPDRSFLYKFVLRSSIALVTFIKFPTQKILRVCQRILIMARLN